MPRSKASVASTIRTVDDVFAALELSGNQSLQQSRDYINRTPGIPREVRVGAIQELHSPLQIFCLITANAKSLLIAMHKYSVILGGPQATAFFYPICGPTDVPWDFYCDSRKCDPQNFIDLLQQLTMYDLIEDISSDDGHRVVHFRGHASGISEAMTIRVFVSPYDTISRILNLKSSYSQSFASSTVAVCFWPKLNAAGHYRAFNNNDGLADYPVGKGVFNAAVNGLTLVKPKNPSHQPTILPIHDKRSELHVFKNLVGVNPSDYDRCVEQVTHSYYAIFNTSTRYLGSVGNMQ
jgi:hypothetical protein